MNTWLNFCNNKDQTIIEAKNTVKYLGVLLEKCLSGANMATSVIQKANARLIFIQKEEIFKFDNQKAFSDVLDTVSF